MEHLQIHTNITKRIHKYRKGVKMADKWKGSAEIIEQKQIAEDIYSVWLQADFIAKTAVQIGRASCRERVFCWV